MISVSILRRLAASTAGLCVGLASGAAGAQTAPTTVATAASEAVSPGGAASAVRLAVDTPQRTPKGNTFVAPAGWTVISDPRFVRLDAPEPGNWLALLDLEADSADSAVAQAWALMKPGFDRKLRVAADASNRDTWRGRRSFDYETSPSEHRVVFADARQANGLWTVALFDISADVIEKRSSQTSQVLARLLPRGYTRESFTGKRALPLDATRVAALKAFVEQGMRETGVPGVGVGLMQGGKIVWAGGLGVREAGQPAPVTADTRFMVASNTKAMVTLMLARLVDQGRLRWDDPVAQVWPAFRLGDAATTKQVLVKHLVCACTGMPRQDLEWLLEYGPLTPAKAMDLLATMQPTSGFGELFQYSNPMAAAAGYLGGHLVAPKRELGAAYDEAMQRLVFDPIGMRDTTQDFDAGRRGNAAVPHAPDVDNRPALALAEVNRSVMPVRPAGGVWSTVNDMLRYVSVELNAGVLPNGRPLLSREAVLARTVPQVKVSDGVSYGMALQTDTVYGTQVVHHGGDMIGFHSDMMWLPEHGVAAVILTNGDPGWLIRSAFRRRLLEVLFDGRPEAAAALSAQARAFFEDRAGTRRQLSVPAQAAVADGLAARYRHPAVGEIAVRREGGVTIFDFGEWRSEVASRPNPDGTVSLVTIVPGMDGIEFEIGGGLGASAGQPPVKRSLKLRDGQHTYLLEEV